MNPTSRTASRRRSPRYPGVALRKAVERLKQAYGLLEDGPAAAEDLLGAWGYSSRSGLGFVVLSALIKYGLLERVGSAGQRRTGITALGRGLAQLPTDGQEYQRLLQQAALHPPIFADLYAEGPADDEALSHLVIERGFTPTAARDVTSIYRESLSFADLPVAEAATVAEDEDQTVLIFQVSDRRVEVRVEGGALTRTELEMMRRYFELQEAVAPDA